MALGSGLLFCMGHGAATALRTCAFRQQAYKKKGTPVSSGMLLMWAGPGCSRGRSRQQQLQSSVGPTQVRSDTAWLTKADSPRLQDFDTVMNAIASNNTQWGIKDVTLELARRAGAAAGGGGGAAEQQQQQQGGS